MKLKVPTTQRHHRQRAACARWLAILQVRFLYGQPTYFNALIPIRVFVVRYFNFCCKRNGIPLSAHSVVPLRYSLLA